jgi:hypothetical protein
VQIQHPLCGRAVFVWRCNGPSGSTVATRSDVYGAHLRL